MLRPLDEAAFWGGSEVLADPPRVHERDDLIYLPRSGSPDWGLYDGEGRIVPEAVDLWGTEGARMGQSGEPTSIRPQADTPAAHYLYIGRAQLHYGHFLVETLPRCWPLLDPRQHRGVKLLVHGSDLQRAWGGWAGHAFAADILGLLGFRAEDVVHFDEPTRIGRVRIPEPALRQQAFGRPAFRRLCRAIGDASTRPGPFEQLFRRRSRKPVWLSRSAVYSGNLRVSNEPALEAALREQGFDIVHPEQTPFAEQVAVFRTRETVCGFAGSAFHTGVFARAGGTRLVLSLEDRVNSNLRLFDRLTGTPARYFKVEGAALVEDLGPDHGGTPEQPFARTYALDDPAGLAQAIARLASGRP